MVEHRHLLLLELLAQIALQAVATSTAMSDKPGQSGAIRGRHLVVIKGHQRSSEVHPRSFEVIRGHPRSSEVIRGRPRSSARELSHLDVRLTLTQAHVITVLEQHTEPLARRRLRNARTHQASSEDANRFDRHRRLAVLVLLALGLDTGEAAERNQPPSAAIRRHQTSSDVIRRQGRHRRPSEAIRGQSEANQGQSETNQRLSHLAIEEANQRPSEANQSQSEANQSQSEVIRGYLTWP